MGDIRDRWLKKQKEQYFKQAENQARSGYGGNPTIVTKNVTAPKVVTSKNNTSTNNSKKVDAVSGAATSKRAQAQTRKTANIKAFGGSMPDESVIRKAVDAVSSAAPKATATKQVSAQQYSNIKALGAGDYGANKTTRLDRMGEATLAGVAADYTNLHGLLMSPVGQLTMGQSAQGAVKGNTKQLEKNKLSSEKATQQKIYDTADKLSENEYNNTVEAQKGLGSFGKTAVSMGIGLAQYAVEAGAGAVTGLGSMPFIAADQAGGLSMQGRKSGASEDKQYLLAISGAAAAVSAGALTKMFNTAAPKILAKIETGLQNEVGAVIASNGVGGAIFATVNSGMQEMAKVVGVNNYSFNGADFAKGVGEGFVFGSVSGLVGTLKASAANKSAMAALAAEVDSRAEYIRKNISKMSSDEAVSNSVAELQEVKAIKESIINGLKTGEVQIVGGNKYIKGILDTFSDLEAELYSNIGSAYSPKVNLLEGGTETGPQTSPAGTQTVDTQESEPKPEVIETKPEVNEPLSPANDLASSPKTVSQQAPSTAPSKVPETSTPAPEAPQPAGRSNGEKAVDNNGIEQAATKMEKDGGTAGANALRNFYDDNVPAADFYADFAKTYEAGRNGKNIDDVLTSVITSVINEPTKKAAYLAGQADAKRAQKAEQPAPAPTQEKPTQSAPTQNAQNAPQATQSAESVTTPPTTENVPTAAQDVSTEIVQPAANTVARKPTFAPKKTTWGKSNYKAVADASRNIIDKGDYSYYGIRVQENDTNNVGDVIDHQSSVWDDGEETGDTLDGLSTVGVDNVNNMSDYGGYYGSVAYLVGSNETAGYGEDAGERILKDATVLSKFYIDDNGNLVPAEKVTSQSDGLGAADKGFSPADYIINAATGKSAPTQEKPTQSAPAQEKPRTGVDSGTSPAPVPTEAATQAAKAKLKRGIKMPIEGKNEDALFAGLKSGTMTEDDITYNGKVTGFNDVQRAAIVKALIDGSKTEAETIHIDVPYDGKFEIANSPSAITKVLSGLKVKAIQDVIFTKALDAVLSKAQRTGYFTQDGTTYITNGYTVVPIDSAAVDFAKETYKATEMPASAAGIAVEGMKDTFSRLQSAPYRAKDGNYDFLVFVLPNGDQKLFRYDSVKFLDGNKLYIGNEHGWLKAVDANGDDAGYVLPVTRKDGKKIPVDGKLPENMRSFSKKMMEDINREIDGKPLNTHKNGGTIKAEEKPAVKEETTHEKPADEGTANEPNGERNGSGGVLEKLPPQNVSKTGSGRNPVPHAGKDGGELGSADSGHDASGNVGGRGEGNSEGGNAQPPAGEVKRPTTADISKSQSETPRGANFVIGESLDLPSGEKSRFKANVEAIQIVKNCIAEGRYATTDEQIALSKYVGWGGLSAAFDSRKADWANEYEQLKGLLTKDEYEAARASTLNAHYTSIDVIRAMYDGLRGMGFTGGRLLEPACGSGNFVGAMPSDMTATVKSWTMVELDPITGNIAKYLYPNSNVLIQGFEKAPLPDNMFDVAISNVPFGNFAVVDKSYPKAVTSAIHNYFFAKTLDKVRPGGLIMFITSRFTMDSYNSDVRKYIADRADLLGAVRLPDTAFKGNAGTEVVTDILVLKKRDAGTPYAGEKFIESPYTYYDEHRNSAYINEYYKEHPEMVLGTASATGSMYSKNELTYKALPGNIGEQIRKALSTITVKMEYPARPTHEDVNIKTAQAASNTKNNGFVAKGGKIYKKHDGELIEQTDMKPEDVKRLTGILGIRDAARKLLELQQQGANSRTISAARAALNSKYDTFAKEFGGLNKQGNARVLKGDPDKFFILALENVAGKDITKSDIFAKDTVAKHITITHTETIGEALAVSQNEKGGVDIPYIASLSGLTPGEATKQLVESGSIFITRNNGYLTSEQYLSGNVRAKLREAKEMASVDREWQRNVDALEKVVPKDLPYTAISVSPGVTWIPTEIYSDFAAHMTGVSNYDWKKNVEVKYDPMLWEFHITATNEAKHSVSNREEWGTPDRTFLKLFEYVLNSRNIKVGHKDEDGKYYTDKKATIAANEKADEIRKEFQRWLWEDDTRRDTVTRIYNDTFNCLVNPHYDGSNLTVDGLSATKTLRPHQKDAVQRIISSGGNTLIAHTVGAGKTAEMASAAMKLRQLGIVKKPLFVVPKSILSQWGKDFLEFYPGAHILVASDNDLDSKHRKTFENRIATGDYDAVIVSYEQFKAMPLSDQTQTDFYEEQIKELEDAIEQAGKDPSVKQLEAAKMRLEAKLAKLGDMKKDLDNIDFEQLGIDGLFVDEAHNYKNLFYASNMNNVAGLGSRDGSQRAFDLYMKVRWLQKLNGGRGVVFATATPVMNSMSEMFIMQKYLQYDMLQQFGLTSFDAWATQFGKVRNVLEVKPSGKGFRQKQSFDKFINVPELLQMFRSCADVITKVPGLPLPTVHRETIKAQPSQFVKDYIDELDERAEAISKGTVDPREDNMLKVTSDGRKVSYSQRMIDPSLPYEPGCKIQLCADKVYEIWEKTKEKSLTQLVFCDLGTPKGEDKNKTAEQAEDDDSPASEATENLSIYNDIKKMLMLKGVPAEEIAFIHEANTAEKKTKLSDEFNSGKVRVLIGSTGKMGVGLNVQKKVIAIHHLDAPWRPGDMTQQDGRGVRQGNENDDIYIYYYVTEGTFDARMMDILQRKSSFINAAMNGSSDIREMEDIGEQALSFAEIKAIASGNPMIREQVEVNNQLQKLFALKSEYAKSVQKAQSRLEDATRGLYTERAELASVEKDLQRRVDVTGDKFTMTLSGKAYTDRDEAGKALIKATKDAAKKEEMGFEKFGSFGGLDLEINSTGDAQLHGDGTYSVNVNLENASGTIQSLETALRSLDSRKTAISNHIGKLTGDIAKLKEIVDKPFDKQDELDKAQARYNEIMAELAPKENEGNDILDDDDDDTEDYIAIDYDSQSVGSARTSINGDKLPAIFNKVHWETGTVNLDYGGGKFDNATEYLKSLGVENYVYDKYNRTPEENARAAAMTQEGQSDTVTVSNVLNVIKEQSGRDEVYRNACDAVKPDGSVYFTVFEGSGADAGSGKGRYTQFDIVDGKKVPSSWQEYRKLVTYMPEIRKYFKDVTIKNGMVTARQPRKQMATISGVKAESTIENFVKPNTPSDWTAQRNSGAEGGKVIPLSDIINRIRHDFGIPVTKGHIHNNRVAGTYDRHAQGIRTQIVNDLPTVCHELGHHLDNIYNITTDLSPNLVAELNAGLSQAMKDAYPKKKWKTEGFAEFLRQYLQSIDTAAKKYPKFALHFLTVLSPDDKAVITELADEVNSYYALGGDTATSAIRFTSEGGIDYRTNKEKAQDAGDKLYQAVVDSNHAIKLFDRAAGSNAYMYATNAAYADNVVEAAVTGDLYDVDGKLVCDGLRKVLKDINVKDDAEWREFGEYLVVRHAPERMKYAPLVFADDRHNNPDWCEQRQQQLEQKYPKFRTAADGLYNFITSFYKIWGEDTGLLARGTVDKWLERWEFYVPFMRAMAKTGGRGVKRGYGDQRAPIFKARGSGAEIIHPVEGLIQNMTKMINAAIRNRPMQMIAQAATETEGLASYLERVAPPLKMNKVDISGVKNDLTQSLEESDIDADGKVQAEKIVDSLDDILLQFQRGTKAGDVLTVLINGKPQYWKINDKMLLQSLVGMEPHRLAAVGTAIGRVNRFMVSNITGSNILWSMFSNMPRDIMTYLTFAKDRSLIKLFSGITSTYVNMLKGDAADAMYKEYMAIGGGHTSPYTAEKDFTKNLRNKITSDNKLKWLNPLEMIDFLSDAIERAPRYAYYRLLRSKGYTPQEAFYGAMDVTTNFRRGGTETKSVNNFVPFLRAGIAGLDKAARWLSGEEDIPSGNQTKEQRKKTAAGRFGAFVAASAILAALNYIINNKDDEAKKNYAQLSTYTKNSYWCIPMGEGKYFAIPKPRELAVLTSLIEASIEAASGSDQHAFDDFWTYASDQLLPNMISDLAHGDIGGAIGSLGSIGIIEQLYANKDFLGRPIVPNGMQYLEPKDQYDARTSKIAYWLGQAFDKSPKQIDFAFNNLFGGYHKVSRALFPVSSENRDWTLGVQNTYVKDNEYSTDIVNRLYDGSDAATKAKNSNPSDGTAAAKAKWYSAMTTFYSNYSKAAKTENSKTDSFRATRQTVLIMTSDFLTSMENGYTNSAQEAVEKYVEATNDTDVMPSAMPISIKDDDGKSYNLSSKEYVQLQTEYLSNYYEYVGNAVSSAPSSIETQGKLMAAAKAKAKEDAVAAALYRRGYTSKDYSNNQEMQKVGLTSADYATFEAALKEADADGNGHIKKSEARNALKTMPDLTDEQWDYLFHQAGNWK